MPATRPRRIVRRAVMVLAVVVLLFTSYLAGAPFAVCACLEYSPMTFPVVAAIYAPIDKYVKAELPGSRLYVKYVQWVRDTLYKAWR